MALWQMCDTLANLKKGTKVSFFLIVSKICQVVVLAVIVGMIVALKSWLGRRGPVGPTTSQLGRTGLPSPVAQRWIP